MKTNYKKGEKVKISKQGIFFSLGGEVESNNTNSTFKPLLVDLGPQGVWSFNYDDIMPVGGESSSKAVKMMDLKPIKKVDPKSLIAFAEDSITQAQKVIDKKNKTAIEKGVSVEEKAVKVYQQLSAPGPKNIKTKKVKRAYVRKDPNTPPKQKRKYIKK